MTEINLGDLVKDTITGLEGTATAKTEWLYGCRRVAVQPKTLKDGKPVEATWFDEPQLKILKSTKTPNRLSGGGPDRKEEKR